jgi:putative transposase
MTLHHAWGIIGEYYHSTIYNWRAKYGGMELSDLKEMKRLQEENRRLKDLYAKVSLENTILQDAIEGKL